MGKIADAIGQAITYIRQQSGVPSRIILSPEQMTELAAECGRCYEDGNKLYTFHGIRLLPLRGWPHGPMVLDKEAFQDYLDRRATYKWPAPSKQFRGSRDAPRL